MWTSVDWPTPVGSGTLVVPRKPPALMSASVPGCAIMIVKPGGNRKVAGPPGLLMVSEVAEAVWTVPGVSCGWT